MTNSAVQPCGLLTLRCGGVILRQATRAEDELLIALMPDDFEHDPTFPVIEGRSLREHRAAWMRQWLNEFRRPGSANDRYLVFVVEHEGRPVGLQTLEGLDFEPARVCETTSFLTPDARGRRLGVLMRSAVLAYAFERWDAARCTSAARPDNVASQRVSERVGYRFAGRREPVVAGHPRPIHVYEMTREMWFAEPRPGVVFGAE